jgi:branched-subunit amino acid aminotransferase/4-amino-4-deoxychorismate lyase
MAKHSFLYNLDRDPDITLPDELNEFCIVHRHVLLIRDPVAVLSSWSFSNDVHGTASPDEVGIVPMLSIYSTLVSRSSFEETSPVILLDSDELVADPEGTLTGLCNDLNIPFTNSMLTWASGGHECDGPWAKWWYADVHRSEGWVVKPKSTADEDSYPASYGISKYRTLPPSLLPALRASLPAYSFLKSLTREAQTRGPLPDEIYEDPRNANLLVWVGAPGRGRILPREMAGVNPWDSSVQGGDAAWEGLRVYRGKILSLERHLRRLFKSAKALGFQNVHTKSQVMEAIFRTLAANGMRDGAHMRLTLTRGEKCTSSMNPKFNVYGTTLIILPEWKPTEGATTYDNTRGISLITSAIRRNPPSCVDSKIHHNNMINNILPKIQANLADAADAIMLDLEGFVSETNATNIFMVDNGTLLTPHADYCLPGITRETVLILAKELGIPCEVRRVSLSGNFSI